MNQIYLLLKTFANSNEGLILYNVHKNGARLVDKLYDATMHQKYFLFLMSAEDINYQNSIENKLIGIAKGVGIEFKDSSNSRRQSNDFRSRMKEKQRKRGVNIE